MNTNPDRDTLRDRIAEVLRAHASLGGTPARYELPFFDGATPSLPRISGWKPLDDVADAVLAVLPEPTDRAAILTEAADELGRMDYDADSNDYGYDTYRDAWNGGVMDAAEELRRLAAEAPTTTKPETDCPDPIECSHEAALGQAREIVRRLAAHAVGFQDVLDDSDCDPWAKTVGADIAALQTALSAAGVRQDGAQPQ